MCSGLLRGKFLQSGKAVPTDGWGKRGDNAYVLNDKKIIL